ncbi:MAG: class I SAM-dependent methyltransferase, partial [Acidobacteriota bacterium]|nr:class I SAM-dependent methyltransferase [Acidobacteriota bacterium]
MEQLLPDQLKAAWQAVEAQLLTAEEFDARQQMWTEEYRQIWQKALLLDGQSDLKASLVAEIARFSGESVEQVEQRCKGAVNVIADEWNAQVSADSPESVEHYYDQSEGYIYDLMWWHGLHDDDSPLGYVTALDFAQRHGCKSYLDFGSGVGAGALLFAKNGFDVALADISSTLLSFCNWRLSQRGLPARFIDLKESKLPDKAFNIITAMDVFEHLVDPVAALNELHRTLKPGGFLFGRFAAEEDESHPQHILLDFAPTFARLAELGFKEVWRDGWL